MGIILEAREFLNGGPALEVMPGVALSSKVSGFLDLPVSEHRRDPGRLEPCLTTCDGLFPLGDSDLGLTLYLPQE